LVKVLSPLKEHTMYQRWTLAAAALLTMGQIGCQSKSTTATNTDLKPKGPVNESQRAINTAIIQTYEVQQVNDAIIRQHTLYPYHFVENSATFNELGWRDVRVLSHHFVSYPGPLNVRKGDTPEVLYKARVKAVVDAMTNSGVKADRIKVTDGLPGGDGLSSDLVVLIMEKMAAGDTATASQQTDGSSSGSMGNKNNSNSSTSSSSKAAGSASGTGGSYK
jgi:hypothetical protein